MYAANWGTPHEVWQRKKAGGFTCQSGFAHYVSLQVAMFELEMWTCNSRAVFCTANQGCDLRAGDAGVRLRFFSRSCGIALRVPVFWYLKITIFEPELPSLRASNLRPQSRNQAHEPQDNFQGRFRKQRKHRTPADGR